MDENFTHTQCKQKLAFFIAQDFDDKTRVEFKRFVIDLAGLHTWVNGPPQFFGDADTIGGYIEIHCALPPNKLARDLDIQDIKGVVSLVNAVRKFSLEKSLAFEFELGNVFVGSIEDGNLDRCLSEGFLGEWSRNLGIAI